MFHIIFYMYFVKLGYCEMVNVTLVKISILDLVVTVLSL